MSILKASRLTPKPLDRFNHYMAFLEASDGETVCVEHSLKRPTLWFGETHAATLRGAGVTLDEKPPGSGRHSALNVAVGFQGRPAFGLRTPDPARVRQTLETLGLAGPLRLDPAVIDRWLGVLRTVFPRLARFDAPDPEFDETEIVYKRERAERLRTALSEARTGPEAAEAVRRAFQGYNLINWRVLDPLTGDWDRSRFGEALLDIARGTGPLEAAVGRAVSAWMEAAPEPQRDHPRQIAGAVAMHLHPEAGIYFRRGVLDELYREAYDAPFPRTEDPAEEFQREVTFARDVFDAFAERGLAPRNLMDVQSALWVVANPDKFGIPEADPVPHPPAKTAMPLNTILYGPPGTGKTYATMARAVAICDGDERAAALDGAALRARHEELRRAGRIAFVTFHQSFSYEDFVEGLRPETDAMEADGTGKAGFRLVARPGILRQMADLAAKGRSADTASGGGPDLDQQRVFKMSLGRAHNEEDAYLFEECTADRDGYVLMGWGGDVDWSAPEFATFEAVLGRWQQVEPSATGNNMNVRAINSLRNDMREGDVVVVSNGNSAFRAVGVVTGPYEFVDRGGVDEYHHRRRVRWTWVEPAGLPVSTILDGQFTMQSIYRITKAKLKLDALAAYLVEQTAAPEHLPHVLVIDEINRANISKVFGELITLLEEDKRAGAPNAVTVRLPYSGDEFSLPLNLHILGTMNTADRSIALLDTALRRRFAFEEMMPRPDLLGVVDGLNLALLLTRLNERIEYLFDRDHLIGHAFFMGATSRAAVDEVMRRKVIPLLAEYFHEDWDRIVAVLGGPKQGFIERVPLPVPPGLDAEGEDRFRYTVRPSFPEDAYAGLQA